MHILGLHHYALRHRASLQVDSIQIECVFIPIIAQPFDHLIVIFPVRGRQRHRACCSSPRSRHNLLEGRPSRRPGRRDTPRPARTSAVSRSGSCASTRRRKSYSYSSLLRTRGQTSLSVTASSSSASTMGSPQGFVARMKYRSPDGGIGGKGFAGTPSADGLLLKMIPRRPSGKMISSRSISPDGSGNGRRLLRPAIATQDELVHVTLVPRHYNLDHIMQIPQPDLGRQDQSTPDRRIGIVESDLDLIDTARHHHIPSRPSVQMRRTRLFFARCCSMLPFLSRAFTPRQIFLSNSGQGLPRVRIPSTLSTCFVKESCLHD